MNQNIDIPHVYAANPLDRGERERRDEEWIKRAAKDPASKLLPMADLNVPIAPAPSQGLTWLNAGELERLGVETEPIFLGLLDGVAHFVADISGNEQAASELQDRGLLTFEDARAATEYVSGPDSGIIAQARAQLSWHNRPRLLFRVRPPHPPSPGEDRCAAAHSATPNTIPGPTPWLSPWCPTGTAACWASPRGRLVQMRRYSALAGFMDQGESIEEAVAREVMEEAGIQVGAVHYHSSQPWPFPVFADDRLPR